MDKLKSGPGQTTDSYYTQQLAKQDEFWDTTIRQYEEQIKRLTAIRGTTIKSIQSLECNMIPFIAYSMAKLSKSQPELDINQLLEDYSSDNNLVRSISVSDTDLPNIELLESFTIQDNDVLYMDIIKSLAAEVQCLKDTIDHLLQEEECLFKTKKEVDMIGEACIQAKENIIINYKQIENMIDKLTDRAKCIENQITDETQKNVELRKEIANMMSLIENAQQQNKKLCEKVKINYTSTKDKLETKVAKVREDIAHLRIKYNLLKEEWYALSPKADEIKHNFNAFAKQNLSMGNNIFLENPESIETS